MFLISLRSSQFQKVFVRLLVCFSAFLCGCLSPSSSSIWWSLAALHGSVDCVFGFLLLSGSMSAAMDKALMAMSLEEVDVPFEMLDLPQFSSCEKNVLSLIGRVLNPQSQTMSSLIFNMPRKWQKIGRVRGVALSNERFQFIFKSEHDLVEVLEKGFQTYNEWGLVMERWSQNPLPDSLQFVHLLVQIRNIPLNYYTEEAITLLGDLVGEVVEVVFDPSKPQNKDFVRVLVKFDVFKPLRKAKVINLPHGQSTTVFYFYEKVQKRCYNCQRLSHERDVCPLLLKQIQDQVIERKLGHKVEKPKVPLVLKLGDPLFGVLKEEQVGIHPILGRPRIAADVLDGMRQYLKIATGEERILREEKVKKSVAEAEKDPFTQKTVLRLEQPPIISHNLNKGKGIVFGYESSFASSKEVNCSDSMPKLMGSAIFASKMSEDVVENMAGFNCLSLVDYSPSSSFSLTSSTAYAVGLSEAGPSGAKKRRSRGRKRPYISKRKPKLAVDTQQIGKDIKQKGLQEGIIKKKERTDG